MRLLIGLVLLLVFIWNPQGLLVAQLDCDYVVATTGDNVNSGSQEQPWRTLQHAADNAQPNRTVCVLAGTYQEEVQLSASDLSFMADGDVIVTAFDIAEGVSNLVLDGFTVSGYEVWGISLLGNNFDITLTGLDISGGEAGIHFTYGYSGESPEGGPVANIELRDSIIHDTLYTAVDCTPGPCNDMVFADLEIFGAGLTDEGNFGADGIAVERGQNILVEDCYVHDNGGDGIDLNSRDVGDEIPSVAIVRRNHVEHNLRNGIKLWHGGEIVNNLVVDNGETALVIEQGSEYLIANNTFANTQQYGYLATLGYDELVGETVIGLYNNIFYNSNPDNGATTLYITDSAVIEADHNLIYNPYREIDLICTEETCYNHDDFGSILGANSIYTDPLLGPDYHPQADSPAIDTALSTHAPDVDLIRTARDEMPDIGAFEYIK